MTNEQPRTQQLLVVLRKTHLRSVYLTKLFFFNIESNSSSWFLIYLLEPHFFCFKFLACFLRLGIGIICCFCMCFAFVHPSCVMQCSYFLFLLFFVWFCGMLELNSFNVIAIQTGGERGRGACAPWGQTYFLQLFTAIHLFRWCFLIHSFI